MMKAIAGPSFLKQMADALGLGPVRSIEIRAAIGEAVEVKVERFLRDDEGRRIVPILERYRLEAIPEGGPVNPIHEGLDGMGPYLVFRFDAEHAVPGVVEVGGLSWRVSAEPWCVRADRRAVPSDRPCRDVVYRSNHSTQ